MQAYHKIKTVYKRNPNDNYKSLMEGVWAIPEFEYLANNKWTFFEKIHGTNVRVIWRDEKIKIKGKSEKSEMPDFLFNAINKLFTEEQMKKEFGDIDVCLYGEGYGKRIHVGGNYLSDKNDFILFDIKIGDWWLKREDIEKVAKNLDINIVPIIGEGTLKEAIEIVRKGFYSTIAENKTYMAEGLVMKPAIELKGRNGKRIISKIKHKDFGGIK